MGIGRFYRLLLTAAWAAGAGALAYSRGGAAVWFMVWLLGGVTLLSLASVFFNLLQVKVTRSLDAATVAPGADLQAELTIRHLSLLPLLWVTVTDRFVRLQDGEEFRVTKLGFPVLRRRFKVRYRLAGLPRGEYRFAGTELLAGDLWGMAVKRRLALSGGTFTVLPDIRPLLSSLVPRGRGADEAADRMLRFGSAVPGHTVREYVRGDPLRSVHWKSTARRGELMTRASEPAEEPRFMVFLDGSSESYEGESGAQLFETGIEWTAGLLQAASDARTEAGLAVGNKDKLWASPSVSTDFVRLHRLLAGLQPDGVEPIGNLLAAHMESRIPGIYTFVVVTPAMKEDTIEALCRLRESGRPVLFIHLLDGHVPSAAERIRKRRLERSGCPVYAVREVRKERTVAMHAEYEGA
jgi:uncharacterized protein (DUF58 family)